MADYYSLLARKVASLEQSTPQTRKAIYDVARRALLNQLRSIKPPIAEEVIAAEEHALDEAVARVEAEMEVKPCRMRPWRSRRRRTPSPPAPSLGRALPGRSDQKPEPLAACGRDPPRGRETEPRRASEALVPLVGGGLPPPCRPPGVCGAALPREAGGPRQIQPE